MPRYTAIIHPKGERHPGSGRKKGTPNPISIEARQLAVELVNGAEYQRRLRRDFEARKLHPTIESLVWAYAIGKPRQDIAINANVNVNARLDAERAAFALLDLAELEALAAESQATVDKAMALVKARNPGANVDLPIIECSTQALSLWESTPNPGSGSDNGGYGYVADPAPDDVPPTNPPDEEPGK